MSLHFPFLSSIEHQFSKSTSHNRFLIGIVGPPASGKSFLASKLPGLIDESLGTAVTSSFAMDAFHHHNDYLLERGIHPHKGCHFTFDVQAFTKKLLEIKESKADVLCPIYDRSQHNPTPDALTIKATDRIVCVEGNYLLLNVFPWGPLKYVFDYTLFIEIDPKIQMERLMERHQAGGKNEQEARAKIHRTDLPNAELIAQFKNRADYIYKPIANSD